jgi:hypothetical protein
MATSVRPRGSSLYVWLHVQRRASFVAGDRTAAAAPTMNQSLAKKPYTRRNPSRVITGVVPVVGGGITLAVPTVTEADSVLAIGRIKTLTLGIPTVVNTALALNRTKTKALGFPTAINTALPIAAGKSRTLGVAAESDAVLALVKTKQKALPTVSEVDLALSILKAGGPVAALQPARTIILNRYGVY